MFSIQLQTFEDLLTCRRLKPVEQVMVSSTICDEIEESLLKAPHIQTPPLLQGLSQLAEGLHSLETGYLLAKEEHKLRLQRDEESSQFDPER